MEKSESLQQFYHRTPQVNPMKLGDKNGGLGHFNVFTRD